MKNYTEGQVVQALREKLDRSTQSAVAKQLGFSPQFINDVLADRRKLTTQLADALGFHEAPRTFTKKRPEEATNSL